MSVGTPADQYIKVGEINTRYWVSGDARTTVILLHGIGDAIDTWGPNIKALAEKHRIYAIDMVGFGRTDKPPIRYSLPLGVRFVRDFMEAQQIEQATLIGNSMGGLISLQFTIQFPDRVEKLVLEDSAGLGKGVAAFFRLFSLPVLGELLTRPSRWGVAWLLKQVIYERSLITDEMVELYYQLASLPGAQRCFLSSLRSGIGFGGQRGDMIRSIVSSLSTIEVPTLIIWGRQDHVIPMAHARVAKEMIPNSRLEILDSCGHAPHLEHSQKYNKLVLEFLAE
jgi:4,5:9,10-diseco-3-hydroxy-5,9,17-trioxoandrosta-1(10),2-diene-4-oate hydrolase